MTAFGKLPVHTASLHVHFLLSYKIINNWTANELSANKEARGDHPESSQKGGAVLSLPIQKTDDESIYVVFDHAQEAARVTNSEENNVEVDANIPSAERARSPAEGSAPANPPPPPEGPACGRWGSQRPGSCWHSPSERGCLASAGHQSTPPPPAAAPALHTRLLSANLVLHLEKKEKKRKEKATPFGVDLMRSQV